MEIRSIIIDDEQHSIDNLYQLLAKHCQQIKIVETALSGEKGREIILKHQPELVFLDIQMPDISGLEMLKSLNTFSFEIIFVTAFDQYGIQAVKFSAIDYLLKPISTSDLKIAVEKVVRKLKSQKQNAQLENLLQLLQHSTNKEEHRIALPSSKETRYVKTDRIIRCESSNAYTTFYLLDGEKLLVSKPIFEFDELLHDYGFIRCHQSHLVNKKYIKSWVKGDGGYLLLDDNTQLPVSKSKRECVLRQITKYR